MVVCRRHRKFQKINLFVTSVLTHLYSGKPPCPIAHQTALSSVNDATASPPSSVLLMNNRSAEFRQI